MLEVVLMPTGAGISSTHELPAPLKVKKRDGRPLVFDDVAQAKFLEGIALGIPRVRCAHLSGVPWPTANSYIARHPEFQQRLDTAEAEAEAFFASSIKRAAAKDHPIAALAWLGRRRPEDWAEKGRVEHGHAHVHALSPQFAQALASLNAAGGNGLVNVTSEVIEDKKEVLSIDGGQKKARRVPRYSKRPTRPRPPSQTPNPVSHAYTPPEKSAEKQKE